MPDTKFELEVFERIEKKKSAKIFSNQVLPNWSVYPMPDIFGNELGIVSEQGFEDRKKGENIL
jgi:hypothetical protein